MLESDHKLQLEARNSFRDKKSALELIWFASAEKPIDNTVKDHRKRLRACVSQRCTF